MKNAKNSIRAARVLRARRETTTAHDDIARAERNGVCTDLLPAWRADAARKADAEKTAADAPRKTGVHGFGRKPGKGAFRRG